MVVSGRSQYFASPQSQFCISFGTVLSDYGGAVINDVMQVGGGGMYFCGTMHEGVGNTPILE